MHVHSARTFVRQKLREQHGHSSQLLFALAETKKNTHKASPLKSILSEHMHFDLFLLCFSSFFFHLRRCQGNAPKLTLAMMRSLMSFAQKAPQSKEKFNSKIGWVRSEWCTLTIYKIRSLKTNELLLSFFSPHRSKQIAEEECNGSLCIHSKAGTTEEVPH